MLQLPILYIIMYSYARNKKRVAVN